MGVVGVHLEKAVVTFGEAPGERFEVRAAEAEFSGSVAHLHMRVSCGDRVGDGAGSVGRGVVHNQQVRVWKRGSDGGDESIEILSLIVGRGDDKRADHMKPADSPLRYRSQGTPRARIRL